MSEPAHSPATPQAGRSRRGQSFVEFALVLPMLLVLLLAIADFARVFTAGITIEAAARDGAEAAAQEYVQRERNDPDPPTADDYAAVHAVAHEVACEEAETLSNQSGSGAGCTMPITAVCVHDNYAGDADCGTASAAVPAECSGLTGGWSPSHEQTTGTPPYLPYVEVRICYQFTTIVNLSNLQLPLGWGLSLGDIWLERDRTFVGGDY